MSSLLISNTSSDKPSRIITSLHLDKKRRLPTPLKFPKPLKATKIRQVSIEDMVPTMEEDRDSGIVALSQAAAPGAAAAELDEPCSLLAPLSPMSQAAIDVIEDILETESANEHERHWEREVEHRRDEAIVVVPSDNASSNVHNHDTNEYDYHGDDEESVVVDDNESVFGSDAHTTSHNARNCLKPIPNMPYEMERELSRNETSKIAAGKVNHDDHEVHHDENHSSQKESSSTTHTSRHQSEYEKQALLVSTNTVLKKEDPDAHEGGHGEAGREGESHLSSEWNAALDYYTMVELEKTIDGTRRVDLLEPYREIWKRRELLEHVKEQQAAPEEEEATVDSNCQPPIQEDENVKEDPSAHEIKQDHVQEQRAAPAEDPAEEATVDSNCQPATQENENKNVIEDETNQEVWEFQGVLAHQGPFSRKDDDYKGSRYNVLVEWKNGEKTYEPIGSMIEDAPLTMACYARDNDLLNTMGWKRLKRVLARDEKSPNAKRRKISP